MLGIIYIKQQTFEEAIAVYEKILAQIPNDNGIIKRLARLYAKTGQQQKMHVLLDYLKKV